MAVLYSSELMLSNGEFASCMVVSDITLPMAPYQMVWRPRGRRDSAIPRRVLVPVGTGAAAAKDDRPAGTPVATNQRSTQRISKSFVSTPHLVR